MTLVTAVTAAIAGLGILLLFESLTGARSVTASGGNRPRPTARTLVRALEERGQRSLARAGLEEVRATTFVVTVAVAGVATGAVSAAAFGIGPVPFLLGLAGAMAPVTAWRRRRAATRRAARAAWPQLIEELRVLTSAAGRPLPQALLEVGLRGPVELRPAFRAAQREWALTTDFERTVAVLKDRLADPTADATCETLLVAHAVGGDLDELLGRLAEDRRRDLGDRQEADAKQAGARLAQWFVLLVPAGMALAGLHVGDGRDAYRTSWGQALVGAGAAMVAACWWWAARIMRLPEPERVFDR